MPLFNNLGILTGSIYLYKDGDALASGSKLTISPDFTSTGKYDFIYETSGSTSVKLITLSSSGQDPRIGIGNENPQTTLDIKEVKDNAVGAEILIRSSRTTKGGEVNDGAGKVLFVIDSGSYADIKTDGAVAIITTEVKAIDDKMAGGDLIFKVSDKNLSDPDPSTVLRFSRDTSLPAFTQNYATMSAALYVEGGITSVRGITGDNLASNSTITAATYVYADNVRVGSNTAPTTKGLYVSGNITSSNDLSIRGFPSVSSSLASLASGVGTLQQVTNAGNITTNPISSSFAGVGFYGTASWAINVVNGGGGGSGGADSAFLTQSTAATTWSFAHNLGTQYPVITVYDTTGLVIIPQEIDGEDTNNLKIYFPTSQSGYATAVGGTSALTYYSQSLTTASVSLNTITFTKGDSSTFEIIVNTGSIPTLQQVTTQGASTTVPITASIVSASSFTGSLFGTASWAVSASQAVSSSYAFNATSASYALSASQAISSSYALNATSASHALTASYALNGGVTQLLAGPNITLSPTDGKGQVTVSATLSGSTIFNTATGSYGSFYDTTTQTNPVGNIPRSMSLNSTDITNGVSISGSTSPFNTYIKTENAGVYNIQFSAQIDKTDSGTDEIVIWLRKNGIDLTDTATTLTLSGNNDKQVAAWNWFVTSAANDYYQIIWLSADTDLRLLAESISGTHPGIPSVILTVNRVDQFLSNTGSFSGSFTGAFTGSLFGTASWAVSASRAITSSFALTASYVNPLRQDVIITGSTYITGGFEALGNRGSKIQLGTYNIGYDLGAAPTFYITGSGLIISGNMPDLNHHNFLKIGNVELVDVNTTLTTNEFLIHNVNTLRITSGADGGDITNTNQLLKIGSGDFYVYRAGSKNSSGVIRSTGAATTIEDTDLNLISNNLYLNIPDGNEISTLNGTDYLTIFSSNPSPSPQLTQKIKANKFIWVTGSNQIISGGLTITGSLNVSQGITSSLFGTASWALNVVGGGGGGGVTINNNVDNYLITATGTANTLNGEVGLQYSSSILTNTGKSRFGGGAMANTTHQFKGSGSDTYAGFLIQDPDAEDIFKVAGSMANSDLLISIGDVGDAYNTTKIEVDDPNSKINLKGKVYGTAYATNATTLATVGTYDIGSRLATSWAVAGGPTLTAGRIVYLSGSTQWAEARANVSGSSYGMLGVVTDAASQNEILIEGTIQISGSALSSGIAGQPVYLSAATAGQVTLTAPTASNNVVRIIGYITKANSNIMYFRPDSTYTVII